MLAARELCEVLNKVQYIDGDYSPTIIYFPRIQGVLTTRLLKQPLGVQPFSLKNVLINVFENEIIYLPINIFINIEIMK